jgi:glutaredoxin
MAPAEPRVTLYGKPGCHLCEDARETVAAVCAELGVEWTEVDITTDEALFRRFGEQIPVTFVDGDQHDFWHVDAARLRAALTADG